MLITSVRPKHREKSIVLMIQLGTIRRGASALTLRLIEIKG